ncbi:PadR family transcriptional regulator [Clostridium thermarum]|uniref:PadR family transcriptional regulator n=1 Tax=Clostridium thermarum TaxID=1716543 RepID=UPI003C2E5321
MIEILPNIKYPALTESTYYILLSLFQPLHGYGIMQFVSNISNSRLVLAPGTLYGAISSLLDKNWIKVYDSNTDSRKKEYIITDLGREVIESEISRLKELYNNGINIVGGHVND